MPGSYAYWRKGNLTISKYFKIQYDTSRLSNISEAEAAESLESKVRESVRLRLRSDVKVGCLLSGGVDSSLVTAIAASESDDVLNTYTIGFEEDKFNELNYARYVAEKFSTNHTEYIFTENEALRLLNKSISQYGEPFGDKSSLPSLLVSSIASKDVKVALNGDGGDELCAGYTKYNYRNIQFALSRLINNHDIYQSYRKLEFHMLSNRLLLNNFTSKLFSNLDPYHGVVRFNEFFRPTDMMKFYSTQLLRTTIVSRIEHGVQLIKGIERGNDFLNKLLEIDHKHYFTDDLLIKMDIASMAYGLEVRSPLLDSSLKNYMDRLPVYLKINGGVNKYLLKRISENYFPTDFIYRKKKGFAIPVRKWLNGQLKNTLDEIS